MNKESFASRCAVQPSGCWLWTGWSGKEGYGRVRRGSGYVQAHRVSYELHKGEIPRGAFVLHRCDDARCVNPDHLYVGVHSENMRDMSEKERGVKSKAALPYGVRLVRRNARHPFKACIGVGQRNVHLGSFATADEANAVAVKARHLRNCGHDAESIRRLAVSAPPQEEE